MLLDAYGVDRNWETQISCIDSRMSQKIQTQGRKSSITVRYESDLTNECINQPHSEYTPGASPGQTLRNRLRPEDPSSPAVAPNKYMYNVTISQTHGTAREQITNQY